MFSLKFSSLSPKNVKMWYSTYCKVLGGNFGHAKLLPPPSTRHSINNCWPTASDSATQHYGYNSI